MFQMTISREILQRVLEATYAIDIRRALFPTEHDLMYPIYAKEELFHIGGIFS